MANVNGASRHQKPEPAATAMSPQAEHNLNSGMSSAHLDQIRRKLAQPFDAAEIKWRVTATSTLQTKHGPVKRGRLIAYADQRAYTDRLNDVFGEWGWTRDYEVQVAQNFERRGTGKQEQSLVAAKVVVVSRVTIHSLGTHTGMGEEWADDENAATRAEAQAFKRACACFGLGRYLYDLDETWAELDEHNRPTFTPSLPEWALPRRETDEQLKDSGHARPTRNQPQSRQGIVRDETLAAVRELGVKVGVSLSRYVVQKYAGVTDPGKIGFAKLTLVLDKLTDIARGIDRLAKARAVIGEPRYAAFCHELNLPSDSVDDIPDRGSLAALLEIVEADARTKEAPGTEPKSDGRIVEARGRLLQEARKAAKRSGKRMEELIEQASGGALSLKQLKDLTEANIPEIEKTTACLRALRSAPPRG